MSAVQKKKPTLEQQVNEEGIRFLGKHVSREKAAALFAATLLACAMPMILGVREDPADGHHRSGGDQRRG